MNLSDFSFVFYWWLTFFFIGISCTPLLLLLFPRFFDRGYIFGKVLGVIILSYITFVFGEIHFLSFSTIHIVFLLLLVAIGNVIIIVRNIEILRLLKSAWKFFLIEELVFFLSIWYWSYIRGNAPDIH